MKTATIDHRRLTLAYDDRGAGRPLVLLHAFPLDRTMWLPQLGPLSAAARVLAVDLPGFGDSTASGGPFTIDSAADAVLDFLDTIGVNGQVVLGGLSMGGYVALAFARRHPDRLAGLVLADTRSEPDDPAGKAKRDEMIALTNSAGTAAVVDQMLPKLLGEPTRKTRPEVVEAVRAIASRQSAATIAAALAALRDRPDATPALGRIRFRTLVLVGENDAITPPAIAQSLVAKISGSKLVTIPGAGHLSNLENPHAFTAAIRDFIMNSSGPEA
jgi:pimeloyl-ACP methyl ester carboxylesterase